MRLLPEMLEVGKELEKAFRFIRKLFIQNLSLSYLINKHQGTRIYIFRHTKAQKCFLPGTPSVLGSYLRISSRSAKE